MLEAEPREPVGLVALGLEVVGQGLAAFEADPMPVGPAAGGENRPAPGLGLCGRPDLEREALALFGEVGRFGFCLHSFSIPPCCSRLSMCGARAMEPARATTFYRRPFLRPRADGMVKPSLDTKALQSPPT